MIKIINDFINEEEIFGIEEVMKNCDWAYNRMAVRQDRHEVVFWGKNLYGRGSDEMKNMILTRIQDNTNKKFKIIHAYVNGQTYGLDGTFHQDTPQDNVYSLVIYISGITKDNISEIGGYTEFIRDNKIERVEPYKGRAVIFNSNIFHRGLAPKVKHILRKSVAVILEEIE